MSEGVAATREIPFPVTVLIVDDEETARSLCSDVAENAGLRVRTTATMQAALEILEQSPVDLVLTDLRLPEASGLELLRQIREAYPEIVVMVLTQYGSVSTAVEAMRLGAVDYVTKPFHVEDLRKKLERAVHALEVGRENRILREQLRTRPGFGGLIGTSARMQKVYRLIERVSQHFYPVLILGESGTGKELVARSIHFMGPRRNKPFVPVDCSALVPTLIESELFGYVRGAFTGATQSKQGLMESAEGGTLFFDEIAELPSDLQAKLLRAIQEREIKPLGTTERVPLSVRIIAATNRDLEAAIRSGAFRQDLYFRLNVVQIKLPPMRERKNDIPLLVTAFLEKFAEPDRPRFTVAPEAMARLQAYDWPGNVRELENAIARAMALSSGPVLRLADLPSNLQYEPLERLSSGDDVLHLAELERRAIFRALAETHGDKIAAARLLGIGKTTLYRKLKEYEAAAPRS